MNRQPRLRDVAEVAGVSVSLVSSYINRPDSVGSKSATKISSAIEQLGFIPNQTARQLRSGMSKMLAFIAFDVSDPFFASVARGAQNRAREAGLSLVLADTNGDADSENDYVSLFEEHRVRGVILAPVDATNSQVGRLTARGIPTVLIDQDESSDLWSSVGVDNAAGGRLAVEHLLSQGCRRIAVVGGTVDIPQVALRRKGASTAAANTPDCALVVVDTVRRDASAGREAVARLLASGMPVDGIFAVNDSIAAGVLEALTETDLRVPEDVAVVGYNDMAADILGISKLSSVHHPHEEFGTAAVELVLEQFEAAAIPRQIRFTPQLVERESSRRLGATKDHRTPATAAALPTLETARNPAPHPLRDR
ncbi:LacI family DNA-binding transcriptional regulator [Plantibacter sp. VKM Ac-2876]|uniref:LacI family DNA-binding transcriptional regulator n=1 Tax=Plantibacter sp. VKM Ac-2876 TaxID=2783826 RepID=UPI00188D5CFE|nr:LacI family DNA-binding transcriptional regulator [Plantibacter sp. VKM Ac-2876]